MKRESPKMLIDPYSPWPKVTAIAVIAIVFGGSAIHLLTNIRWIRTQRIAGMVTEFRVDRPLWAPPAGNPPDLMYELDVGHLTRRSVSLVAGLALAVFLIWLLVRSIRHSGRPGECPGCRYNLRGLKEVGCPECGWGRDPHDEAGRS